MNCLVKALLTLTLAASPSLCAADSIIVYRSRAEAEMDAFWWDHPEAIVWGVAFVMVLVVIFFAVKIWDSRRR